VIALGTKVPQDDVAKRTRLLTAEANGDAKILMPRMFDQFTNVCLTRFDTIVLSLLLLERVLERFQEPDLVVVLSILVKTKHEPFEFTTAIKAESCDMPCAADFICPRRGRYRASAERRRNRGSGARTPKPINATRDVPDVTLQDRIPTVVGWHGG
jgi:hypothetical protein